MITIAKKSTRVVVYFRVSGVEQRQAETIQNQVDFAERYCDLYGLTIADFYTDDGITGTIPLDERLTAAGCCAMRD